MEQRFLILQKNNLYQISLELKTVLENNFAGQYALMLRESNDTGDIFYGLKWDGLNLVADNPGNDATIETAGHWAKKEFMENDFGSNVTRSEKR